MRLCFLPLIAVATLFIPATISGNIDESNNPLDHSNGRQLKKNRFLCQVSSSTTLSVTLCYKERQLCDTSTGEARCICAEGWKGARCKDRIYEPPSVLPTKKPTFLRVGSICNESSECAITNTGCFEGQCRCESGYTPRKGNCININECEKGFTNACHRDAECVDYEGGYDCLCRDGFSDSDPTASGRKCKQTNECTVGMHNCDETTQVCIDRRPPEKWECVEKTPAPTPKPTPYPISTNPPTMEMVALHTCQGVLDLNEK